VADHFFITEAQEVHAVRFDLLLSALVFLLLVGMPAELQAAELPVSDSAPELPLGQTAIFAQVLHVGGLFGPAEDCPHDS